MSEHPIDKKIILVTGATGRQGRSFINALTTPNSGSDSHFHILALTRNAKRASAQSLASKHVTVIEGDLDAPDSIRKIFESQRNEGHGIWGVFCVLAFPGLGVNADGEEKQGKTLADLSLEFGVSHYVFSSVERGGEGADDTMLDDRLAKIRIEKHVKELGKQGLTWTILRPGFFMENYEGTLGSITFGVLKAGLKPTTTIQLIAVDDIGRVAAAVLKDPSSFESQIVVPVGDTCTIAQQEKAHQEVTGKPMPYIPAFFARTLISINSTTKRLISDMERVHSARSSENAEGEYHAQLDRAKRAYPHMKSFEEWCRFREERRTSKREKDWNGVTLGKLLTGRQ
ncbi:NAD(P)-binding protein [Marasmius fiardii PR-910]|nr:NAD(P)-binding protein [Marasmius fiardii PR-910]